MERALPSGEKIVRDNPRGEEREGHMCVARSYVREVVGANCSLLASIG